MNNFILKEDEDEAQKAIQEEINNYLRASGSNSTSYAMDIPLKALYDSTSKTQNPGTLRFFDEKLSHFWPLGDKFGGLPDSVASMTSFCVYEIFDNMINFDINFSSNILKTSCD